MARRKLSKKDFERMLNEKAAGLLLYEGFDLTGMDDYFEAWKYKKGVGGFGSWLRYLSTPDPGLEFQRRYQAGWRKGHETKKLMKAQSIDETMKFIYDEADHIMGTAEEVLLMKIGPQTPGRLSLKMIREDAKAIQKYAKQVMVQLTTIANNRRELFINGCKVLEGRPSERK